jgi:preprotein translocase subunit SecF
MRSLINNTQFDFMGRYRLAVTISSVLIVVALLSIAIRGLNLGVDFTGGYTIEVGYEQAADLNAIRSALSTAELPDSQVQTFGTSTEVLIRMAPKEGFTGANVSTEVLRVLAQASESEVTMRRVEFVGPQVGEELRENVAWQS